VNAGGVPKGVAEGGNAGGRPGERAEQCGCGEGIGSAASTRPGRLGGRQDTHPTRVGRHSPNPKRRRRLSRNRPPRTDMESHRVSDRKTA